MKTSEKKLFGKFRKEEDAENTVGNKADDVPDSEEMPEYSDSTLNDKIDKNDKKDEKKRSDPELSFKEKVLKRTQEAVLDKVVEDTIRSFDK